MNIIRYFISNRSTNLRHWTVRAVALEDGREVEHPRCFFKGVKRECKAERDRLNLKLKSVLTQ